MRKLMKIFVVLICSLGLVTVAYSAQPEENKQKKKQPPAAQHAPPPTMGHAPGGGAGPKRTPTGAYEAKKGQGQGQTDCGQGQGSNCSDCGQGQGQGCTPEVGSENAETPVRSEEVTTEAVPAEAVTETAHFGG